MNVIKRVPKLLYIPFLKCYFIIIKLCNATLRISVWKTFKCLHLCRKTNLVSLIKVEQIIMKSHDNNHEINMWIPNFCIPLYMHSKYKAQGEEHHLWSGLQLHYLNYIFFPWFYTKAFQRENQKKGLSSYLPNGKNMVCKSIHSVFKIAQHSVLRGQLLLHRNLVISALIQLFLQN